MLSSRRFRDLAFVGIALLAMSLGIVANLFSGPLDSDVADLRRILADAAVMAGRSLFGWAWAVPADVARAGAVSER